MSQISYRTRNVLLGMYALAACNINTTVSTEQFWKNAKSCEVGFTG